MKILFFTYDFPYPTTSGGKMRAYNLMKEKDSDIELYLFSFIRPEFDSTSIEHMRTLGIKDIRIFQRKKVKDPKNLLNVLHPKSSIFRTLYYDPFVAEELLQMVKENKIDVVHFESYYTGFYISDTLKKLGVKQIFGTENIESHVYRDFIKYKVTPLMKPLFNFQLKKIQQEEEQMFKDADTSLAVTQEEADHINTISRNKCFVIENGVDLEKFTLQSKSINDQKTLLFIGNFTYFPNVDAAEYFYKNVFTKLDKNTILKIIGKNSSKLSFVKDAKVLTAEYVEDIITTYNEADIFVSPIRIGGGTNFKIIESMAVGLPVIAFTKRAEALQIKTGVQALLVDNAQEYKTAIEKLFSDSILRNTLVKNARKLIEEKYSWKVIGKNMNKVWRNA